MAILGRRFAPTIALAVLIALGWLGGCSESPGGPCFDCPPEPLVVSDPVSALSVASAAGAAPTLTSSAGDEVAYVSLPPGTVPTGRNATIRRVGGAGPIITAVFDGGLDPTPVVAGAGDFIEVLVTDAAGGTLLQERLAVVARRPPVVVRTDPPRRKTDVPLNAAIVVVFSEPIDAATLTAGSVQLLRGTAQIAGRLEFRDSEHLTVAFVPATALAADADYRLVVSQEVRDQDGEPLDTPVAAEFRTAAFVTTQSQIAFFSFDDAIYVVNADGTDLTKLTTDGANMYPSWSPDGSRIAFASDRDAGNWDIYVMNADGSGVTRLTADPGYDSSPNWSPDGSKIAFSSTRGDGSFDIYVMNADGSNVTRLTDDPAFDASPDWSPDGTRLAFTTDRDGPGVNYEIYAMNADGSAVIRLTNDPDPNDSPDWSPDGTKIAYHRFEPLGTGAVYVMNADGSGSTRLTNGGGAPSWSRDGTRIVYSALLLSVMNADGSGLRSLNVEGYEPAWSPVGPATPSGGALR